MKSLLKFPKALLARLIGKKNTTTINVSALGAEAVPGLYVPPKFECPTTVLVHYGMVTGPRQPHRKFVTLTSEQAETATMQGNSDKASKWLLNNVPEIFELFMCWAAISISLKGCYGNDKCSYYRPAHARPTGSYGAQTPLAEAPDVVFARHIDGRYSKMRLTADEVATYSQGAADYADYFDGLMLNPPSRYDLSDAVLLCAKHPDRTVSHNTPKAESLMSIAGFVPPSVAAFAFGQERIAHGLGKYEVSKALERSVMRGERTPEGFFKAIIEGTKKLSPYSGEHCTITYVMGGEQCTVHI